MDFWELLKVVARRWMIVVPFLLVTAVGAVRVPPTIEPTYSANASTAVVSPINAEPALNPYLALGVVTMTQAITGSADGPAAKQLVSRSGNSPDFDVVQENSRQPIIVVNAEAPTPEGAVATVAQVLDNIDVQLQDRQAQAGARSDMMYTTQRLTAEVLPVPVYESAQRVRYLIVAIGVMLAVGSAVLAEGIAVLRRRRRTGEVATLPTDQQLRLLSERMDLLDERERLLDEREHLLVRSTSDDRVPVGPAPDGTGEREAWHERGRQQISRLRTSRGGRPRRGPRFQAPAAESAASDGHSSPSAPGSPGTEETTTARTTESRVATWPGPADVPADQVSQADATSPRGRR